MICQRPGRLTRSPAGDRILLVCEPGHQGDPVPGCGYREDLGRHPALADVQAAEAEHHGELP